MNKHSITFPPPPDRGPRSTQPLVHNNFPPCIINNGCRSQFVKSELEISNLARLSVGTFEEFRSKKNKIEKQKTQIV